MGERTEGGGHRWEDTRRRTEEGGYGQEDMGEHMGWEGMVGRQAGGHRGGHGVGGGSTCFLGLPHLSVALCSALSRHLRDTVAIPHCNDRGVRSSTSS